jgi:hypothetical protein
MKVNWSGRMETPEGISQIRGMEKGAREEEDYLGERARPIHRGG